MKAECTKFTYSWRCSRVDSTITSSHLGHHYSFPCGWGLACGLDPVTRSGEGRSWFVLSSFCHFSFTLHLSYSLCCFWFFQDQDIGNRHNRKKEDNIIHALAVHYHSWTKAECYVIRPLSMGNSALNWCGWADHWYHIYLLCKIDQHLLRLVEHWSSQWTPAVVNILGMRGGAQVPVFRYVSTLLGLLGVSHKNSLTLCSDGSMVQAYNFCPIAYVCPVGDWESSLLLLRGIWNFCVSLTDSTNLAVKGQVSLFWKHYSTQIPTKSLQLVNILLMNP